jgi:hypothetical protein
MNTRDSTATMIPSNTRIIRARTPKATTVCERFSYIAGRHQLVTRVPIEQLSPVRDGKKLILDENKPNTGGVLN